MDDTGSWAEHETTFRSTWPRFQGKGLEASLRLILPTAVSCCPLHSRVECVCGGVNIPRMMRKHDLKKKKVESFLLKKRTLRRTTLRVFKKQPILHVCSREDRILLAWGETRADWTSERLFNALITKALWWLALTGSGSSSREVFKRQSGMLWESRLCNLPSFFSALFSYSFVRQWLMQKEINACAAYHKQQVILSTKWFAVSWTSGLSRQLEHHTALKRKAADYVELSKNFRCFYSSTLKSSLNIKIRLQQMEH